MIDSHDGKNMKTGDSNVVPTLIYMITYAQSLFDSSHDKQRILKRRFEWMLDFL
jgi:hypothetical protein